MLHGFKIFLAIERRLTAAARRGNRLTIFVILHVSASEYTRNTSLGHTRFNNQVSELVGFELSAEEIGVRLMADRTKMLSVSRISSAPVALSFTFRPVTPQEIRFFHRGVAAANYDDLLVPEEEAVACRASADAASEVFLLVRDAHIFGRSAGRNDQRFRRQFADAFYKQLEWMLRQVNGVDPAGAEFGAETLGLLSHIIHQFRAQDAFGNPGKFSTSVVVVICPPGSGSSKTSGFRFALAPSKWQPSVRLDPCRLRWICMLSLRFLLILSFACLRLPAG